jgi:hypothetical protein
MSNDARRESILSTLKKQIRSYEPRLTNVQLEVNVKQAEFQGMAGRQLRRRIEIIITAALGHSNEPFQVPNRLFYRAAFFRLDEGLGQNFADALAVVLLALSEQQAAAQNRVTFQVFGGMGLSNLYSKECNSTVRPRILPHAGTSTQIPLEGRFSLKTGLAYEQKGWKVHSSLTDTMENIRDEHTSVMRMHTVRVPMQLCYTFGNEKALSYTVSAGMSYVLFHSGGCNMAHRHLP